jgi:adenosylcobinamide kinase/adenosylcobinamide-phosphate guanylyltransferase
VRGQTGALVDGRLLIDCGPEIPAAASRHGAGLSDVRVLLFTHAHPDHVGPAALLFRHWAQRDEPLDVFAPENVVEQLRHWVAPDDPVQFSVVQAGDSFDAVGYQVRALPATHGDATTGDAVLFDITGPAGERLFYATDTGPLTDSAIATLATARFDVVLLEETFGDHVGHDGDHLDLTSFPEQLRQLRQVEAVVDSTTVVAVHLSHHNPPTAQLQQRLRPWGAQVVADGSTLTVGDMTDVRPSDPLPRRTLVLGGARSGKSRHAELLVASAERVTYVATSDERPDDPEWVQRIEAHRRRRPTHWHTLETTDVAGALEEADPHDVLLVDCLTLWLTQVMDATDAWSGDLSGVDKEIDRLLRAWRDTRARVVAVSNEVGQGVVPATASGRLFRDTHGRLNAQMAAASESVTMMVAGRPVKL